MYPAYQPFSLAPITDLARIIRGGTIKEDSRLFCKAGHTLAGTGLGVYPGEPEGVEELTLAAAVDSDVPTEAIEDCVGAIDGLLDDGLPAKGEGEEAFDPTTILMILQIVGPFLKKLIERRRNPPAPTEPA